MLQYTLKRLMLVPVTFFMVSIIIFCVLNIAPGRPGSAQSVVDTGEQGNSGNQRESYRIFKEQFGLDKPILVNTRPGLEYADIERVIGHAHDIGGRAEPAERIEAQEQLDDYGRYMVRHLIRMLNEHPDSVYQRYAAHYLTTAAKKPFIRASAGWTDEAVRKAKDAARAENRTIGQFNQGFSKWKWADGASSETISAVKTKWNGWWETHGDNYRFDFGDRLGVLFGDTRFALYWGNLIRFDFGVSSQDRKPVLPSIISKLKYSLSLTFVSVILAYLIAVPIGIFSAVRQNTAPDLVITIILFVLYSLPTFFTGTVLLRLLSTGDPLAWFPPGGFESSDGVTRTTWGYLTDVLWYLTLPLIVFTARSLAALSRYARSGVIDVIRSDYVRTARAKGLHEFVVIMKHAVRNGMIPILTLLGGLLPVLISGSVIIEVIFNIPGMGLFLFNAINLRDYNVVMGILTIASLLTLLGILISDLLLAAVDPRISFD